MLSLRYTVCFALCAFLFVAYLQEQARADGTNYETGIAVPKATERKAIPVKPSATEKAPDLAAFCESTPLWTGGELIEEQQVNEQYTFRLYRKGPPPHSSETRYEILQKGKIICTSEGGDQCGLSLEGWGIKLPPPGTDITGEGVPNLAVACTSGGSHCCAWVNIFSLGKSLKAVKHFDVEHGGLEITDLDGDGIYEAKIRDQTFDFWSDEFRGGVDIGKADQVVILRYENGDYRIAPDLMKRFPRNIKPPSLQKIADEFAAGGGYDDNYPQNRVSFEMWRYMLGLVYNGEGEEAFRFCRQVWPLNREGEEEFIAAFRSQLAKSPYWPGIKVLNGW